MPFGAFARLPYAHAPTLLLALALVPCLSSLVTAQRERQTKLLIPKIVPEAKPEPVPRLGHLGEIGGVAFSPDGRRLASSARRTLVWNLQTGVPETELVGGGPLAFSQDGRTLVSPSTRWDTESWEPRNGPSLRADGSFIRVQSAVSPEARLCARRLIDTSAKGGLTTDRHLLEVVDVRTGKVQCTFDLTDSIPKGTVPLGPLRFLPGGERLACSPFMSKTGAVCPILILDAATGRIATRLDGHPYLVRAIAVAPTGDRLASLSFHRVTCWNLQSGSVEWTQQVRLRRPVSLGFSPDGRTLAVGLSGGRILLKSSRNGREQATVRLPVVADVRRVCFSQDGQKLAAASLSHVFVYRTGTWANENALWGFARPFASAAFDDGGRRLIVSEARGSMVWDLGTGRVATLNGVDRPLCLSADGSTWAHGSDSEVHVGHFDTGPDCVLKTSSRVRQLAFSPDGQRLCAGTREGRLRLWEGKGVRVARKLGRHEAPVSLLRFSPDGRLLVSAAVGRLGGMASGAWQHEVMVWDVLAGIPVQRLASGQGEVTAAAFGPDGRQLAWATSLPKGEGKRTAAGRVTLWDLRRGGAFGMLSGHAGRIVSLAFSRDGRGLVSASRDGTIIHWDVAAGRMVHKVEGLPLKDGALSPDGTIFALLQTDGSVSLLDTTTGDKTVTLFGLELRRTSIGDSHLSWLAVTSEGYFDCSLGGDEALLWKVGAAYLPFDSFADKYHRPDLVRKVLAGEDITGAPPLDGTQIPPNIKLAAPGYGAEVTEGTVRVVVAAAGVRPIQRLDMTINGRPVPQAVAEALTVAKPADHVRTFEFDLPLTGSDPLVRLRAAAYDTEGLRSRIVETVIRRPGMKQERGDLYLLAVGLSNYQDPRSALGFAAADAKAFRETLEAKQRGGYWQTNARVLTDEDATVSNLKFGLRWLKDEATENDIAVVFLAGHGLTDGEGNYYFGAYEMDRRDPKGTCLDWGDFVSFLRECRAKQVAVWADTCHAGSVTGAGELDRLVDRLNRKASVLVFAASRGEEASVERDDWGHGAFTKAFMEAMEGKADTDPEDGQVTVAELRDYVIERVEQLTEGRQHPYMPRLQDFDPDLIMARTSGAGRASATAEPATARTSATGTDESLSSLGQAPTEHQQALSQRLRAVNYRSNRLQTVLHRLLGDAGIPCRLEGESGKLRVTVTSRPRPLSEVLQLILDNAGAVGTWEGDTLVVRAQKPTPKE